MTPQSIFTILAPVAPAHEARLRELLDSMNVAPGRVNPENALVPFSEFDELHFARLLILEDKTTGDARVHGLTPQTYPLYLAFLGDIDGREDVFLSKLAARAPEGLQSLFSCCEDFPPDSDLVDWMRRHRSPSIANYVNARGRTVRQVRQEATLREFVEEHLAQNAASFENLPARKLHAALSQFVDDETTAGRLTLSAEDATPLSWWMRNKLHLIGFPVLFLLALPLILVIAPFYLLRLRQLEKTDPEVCPPVDQKYSEDLALTEDHAVSNQFSAFGSLKPGFVRLLTVMGVLTTIDYAARHIVRSGRLGRIRTIHFARWAFIAGKRRMAFFSNYDGGVESYMDDFINKTGFGLNASFSNGIGYPRTNWLVFDGCADERKYKEYIRRHTIPTQVWYMAYPGLTAIDLERNTLIRKGLDSRSLTDDEARAWVALL